MKVAVLLSAARHPVSGEAVLSRLEAQAIRMGAPLGAIYGLHAGIAAAPVSDALGHGLSRLQNIAMRPDADPLPLLAAVLSDSKPDLILAGRRSQGNEETGLLPYALAKALAMAIVSDATAIAPGTDPGMIQIEQALPKGARRRVIVRLPAVVTVHPSAPPPLPFAFGQARRGRVETLVPAAVAAVVPPTLAIEERPYRPRPKMMRAAPAGASASDRLKAATGDMGGGKAEVMVDPPSDVAAREILAYLRRVGVLPPRATDPS